MKTYQVIHGDYVATPIKNAFNSKTAYWLTKKGYTVAVYMFTVENCSTQKDLDDLLNGPGFDSYVRLFEEKFNNQVHCELQEQQELIPLLDATTGNNLSYHADLVQCMNCGRNMLVDVGSNCCPECDAETLAWIDTEMPEVDVDSTKLRQMGYELMDRCSYEECYLKGESV